MNNLVSHTSKAQARASDPANSAWVSANAGSGKTHVLVNRIVRLLLDGAEPERILCLTYTRAAAAEMSNRLFKTLASWIALDDETLIGIIHRETGHVRFDRTDLDAARRLFTRSLETPGGLKIQTVHAFCERLLQRFPIEAGVVPGFEVLDEATARELLKQAQAGVLSLAAKDPASLLGQALVTVAAHANADRLDELLRNLIAHKSVLAEVWSRQHGREDTIARLHGELAIAPGETAQDVAGDAAALIAQWDLDRTISALHRAGGTTDVKLAGDLASLRDGKTSEQLFTRARQTFLTAKGTARKQKGLFTKKLLTDAPDVADLILEACDRMAALAERERAINVYTATVGLLDLADAVIGHYEAAKRRAGRYDYDDLITRTRSLFIDQEDAQWVLYKLDGGLDHILIDEAQDTSPDQWQIIKSMAVEFFAGDGVRPDTERTIFAVGDRKQSIFSFQGADPEEFDRTTRQFSQLITAAQLSFEKVPLNVSFRSTKTVLDAVDAVFSLPAAAYGLAGVQGEVPVHQPVRVGHAGRVELWPPVTGRDRQEKSPWQPAAPEDIKGHPRLQVAARVAATIRDWIDHGEILTPRGRPVRYADILILVRHRTTFMDGLVRALKQRNIPVAGADRLVLTGHIAVQDLMSLGRFVLLASDDLSLAEVLKSPLVARDDGAPVDDDDLFTLAHGRGPRSLWHCVKQAAEAGQPYRQAVAQLTRWRGLAHGSPPYEFYTSVLIGDGRRKALMARLGSEAAEPIDAFVATALDFDDARHSGLHGFLAALEGSDATLKRDMDQGSDEVRIMTVHGAKGLEANIVFLPDTCNVPDGKNHPSVLLARDEAGHASMPVWTLRAGESTGATDKLKAQHQEAAMAEYNRLLYVAMTRARDWLYVAGFTPSKEPPADSWYVKIETALKHQATPIAGADGETAAWRIEGDQNAPVADDGTWADERIVAATPPNWAVSRPPGERSAFRWLAPSRLAEGADDEVSEQFTSPLAGEGSDPFKRGTLIHRLLQTLPDYPENQRQAVGASYLSRPGLGLDKTQADAILREAMTVMSDQRFSSLFAPGSLAEVPLAAMVTTTGGDSHGLSGRIDRLAVSDTEVLIADYKTNRPPPDRMEHVPASYLHQLAAYRLALAQVFPGRTIRTFLVWTDGPSMMEIPNEKIYRLNT